MSDAMERQRRKRKYGPGGHVLSLYLIQCLDGTRPASQMPNTESLDDNDSILMPQFAKIKKTDDELNKPKWQSCPAQATIVRSQGCFLYDRQGNSYLDCVSGVSHVGHCHPRVTQTAQLQMARFGTGIPSYLVSDNSNDGSTSSSGSSGGGGGNNSRYVDRIIMTMPNQLNTVLFFTSGSEANDAAVQMARAYTGNYDVVVFEDGFHGSLGLVSEVSPKLISRGGVPKKPWVHILPVPDTYRGPYLESDPHAYEKYFLDAKAILDEQIKNGRKIACLLTEPIFTFHSVFVPPVKYFQKICNYIRELGGLVIIDEVQTGLGRVGAYTWGFQMHDIIPDIVTTGKPLGNGHPLAITVASKEIANSIGILQTMYDATLAQEAIGNTVLDVMENEDLQENAWNVGNMLVDNINGMMKNHKYVGAVRGMGLLLGIEFVWDRETKAPAREVAQSILYQMREQQIITAVEGHNQNIIFLIPPLCFSDDDAKKFTNALKNILEGLEGLSKDVICENINNEAERYSKWNNIPTDYLSAYNTHRGERSCPGMEQPRQTSPEGHIVEIEEEDESDDDNEDEEGHGSHSDNDDDHSSYNELD